MVWRTFWHTVWRRDESVCCMCSDATLYGFRDDTSVGSVFNLFIFCYTNRQQLLLRVAFLQYDCLTYEFVYINVDDLIDPRCRISLCSTLTEHKQLHSHAARLDAPGTVFPHLYAPLTVSRGLSSSSQDICSQSAVRASDTLIPGLSRVINSLLVYLLNPYFPLL